MDPQFQKKTFSPPVSLLIALTLYWLLMAFFIIADYRANDGHLIYVLDDPYIHMSIARNLALNGTFGINPGEFTSTSSSILWTLILTLVYKIFGVSNCAPLVLNMLFASLCLVLVSGFSRRLGLSDPSGTGLLVGIILLTPMVPVSMTGMEHTLHMFAAVAVIYASWRVMYDSGKDFISRNTLYLCVATIIFVSVRYESLFLVPGLCLVFYYAGKVKEMCVFAVSAVLHVIVFGCISTIKGAFFLPNTVLLKGFIPGIPTSEFIHGLTHLRFFSAMIDEPHMPCLLMLLMGISVISFRRSRRLTPVNFLMVPLMICVVLHGQFARFNWFYRYEAYIVILSLILIAANWSTYLNIRHPKLTKGDRFSKQLCWLILGILCLMPLVIRGFHAHNNILQASHDIYRQQYQMGRFLSMYHDGKAIAANDVGAINYLSNIQCFDLCGLANSEVTGLKLTGKYDTAAIREIAGRRQVAFAIVYMDWFTDEMSLPPEWERVGTWTIQDNLVCAGSTVTFLAVDLNQKTHLIETLQQFTPLLPDGVSCTQTASSEDPT